MTSGSMVLMAGGLAVSAGAPGVAGALAHTEQTFEFSVDGPMAVVAPLFGADRERAWAPGWAPRFLHPTPAADVAGSVFLVDFGERDAVWVTTDFDLAAGRAQYVYVVPDVLVTVITLRITPAGERTHVQVKYDRTALRAEASAEVRQRADQDRQAGPEWQAQINAYLASRRGR